MSIESGINPSQPDLKYLPKILNEMKFFSGERMPPKRVAEVLLFLAVNFRNPVEYAQIADFLGLKSRTKKNSVKTSVREARNFLCERKSKLTITKIEGRDEVVLNYLEDEVVIKE